MDRTGAISAVSRNFPARRPPVSMPNAVVKAVFFTQLILTTCAALSSEMISGTYGGLSTAPAANVMLLMPASFLYMNGFVLFFALYAILHTESSQSVFMYFCCNLVAIVPEIIFLGVNNSRYYEAVVTLSTFAGNKGEYQFSLAMAIINLLIRPVAAYLLYRVYQDRLGISSFTLPGFPSTNAPRSAYENLGGAGLTGFGASPTRSTDAELGREVSEPAAGSVYQSPDDEEMVQ